MADVFAGEPTVHALPSIVDLPAAQALKEILVEELSSGVSVRLDGADVERIGTPAVQVLLAAARTFSAQGRTFVLARPSAVLSAAFADLGLSRELAAWRSS